MDNATVADHPFVKVEYNRQRLDMVTFREHLREHLDGAPDAEPDDLAHWLTLKNGLTLVLRDGFGAGWGKVEIHAFYAPARVLGNYNRRKYPEGKFSVATQDPEKLVKAIKRRIITPALEVLEQEKQDIAKQADRHTLFLEHIAKLRAEFPDIHMNEPRKDDTRVDFSLYLKERGHASGYIDYEGEIRINRIEPYGGQGLAILRAFNEGGLK